MATRARGTVRECPVTRLGTPCAARVAPGKLMCPGHWRRVPKALRDAVNSAWRLWGTTHTPEDWDTYLGVRAAALDAVNT